MNNTIQKERSFGITLAFYVSIDIIQFLTLYALLFIIRGVKEVV